MERWRADILALKGRSAFCVRAMAFALSAAALNSFAGCSSGPAAPPLGAVEGKVTLDGSPAEGLAVVFMPETGRSSTGVTDKEGKYVLEFDPQHRGATVGQHKIRITRDVEAGLAAGKGDVSQLPPRYNTETTLEATIKSGENVKDFELTSSP